jgi:hypothetical protein
MTLKLLCRRTITLQRAVVSAGPDGSQVQVWSNLASSVPASIFKLRARRQPEAFRASVAVDTVIMTPVDTGARLDDRIFDGHGYYRVQWVMNLGDRDQAWGIYAAWLDPQGGQ